ncbi:hypothetical protein [Lactococcus ileimucosae]|uniref:hypothetical protein n=1 Tax=Lactococcus ileimucosae TaxID=2941329 RepID=UPI002043736A|nr:hypothetical protein [Lactococcus ileimucosae]
MKQFNFLSKITFKKRYIIPILLLSVLSITSAGTFTWTSISQRAVNETRFEELPGGRLHDDFEGLNHLTRQQGRTNKDIYVENYSSENILARVRLSEYMEVGAGAGAAENNQATPLSGAGLENATLADHNSWAVVRPGGYLSDATTLSRLRDYVTLHLGDDNSRPKIFMPTFNQNNQSQESNTTGRGLETLTGAYNTNLGISMPGTHDQWSLGQAHTSTLRTWDARNGAEVLTSDVTHTAQATVQSQHGGYMTMNDWIALGRPTGNFWVHDNDGWFYWATWVPANSATSLLLDALEVNFSDGESFYGMHVESDLATAEDISTWQGVTASASDLMNNIIN